MIRRTAVDAGSGHVGPFADVKSAGRSIRLLLDRSTVSMAAGQALSAFEGHPAVELWSTKDEGLAHVELHQDGLVNDHVPVTRTSLTQRTMCAVYPASTYRTFAGRAVASGKAPDEESAYSSLLLGQAADGLKADILVTEDPLLLGQNSPGVTKRGMSVADSLASLGLYLRHRNDFSLERVESHRVVYELSVSDGSRINLSDRLYRSTR